MSFYVVSSCRFRCDAGNVKFDPFFGERKNGEKNIAFPESGKHSTIEQNIQFEFPQFHTTDLRVSVRRVKGFMSWEYHVRNSFGIARLMWMSHFPPRPPPTKHFWLFNSIFNYCFSSLSKVNNVFSIFPLKLQTRVSIDLKFKTFEEFWSFLKLLTSTAKFTVKKSSHDENSFKIN